MVDLSIGAERSIPEAGSNPVVQSIRNFQPVVLRAVDEPSRNEQSEASLPHISLFGLPVVSCPREQLLNAVISRTLLGTRTRIAFINAHCANVARADWRYREAIRSSDYLLPDGIGVELASTLSGQKIEQDHNGTDLFEPLCRRAATVDLSIFLMGGRPGIAAAAATNIQKAVPGMRIAGVMDGYFAPQDEDDVISQINESGADIVFLGLGVPQQDVWLARLSGRLKPSTIIGVGGLLDFVSGTTPRAPAWMRQARLEWMFRLLREPRRMWQRYLIGNISFLIAAAHEAVRPFLARGRSMISAGMKRGLDILGSFAGLAVSAPLFLVVACMIRLESKGPALFKQTRIGRDGTPFDFYKFRSMFRDAESRREQLKAQNDRNDGVTFKMKNDPRITKIGRFIRKYSIDELPQLWNVLRGDMSLVGPRPALPCEVENYTQTDMRRLDGLPGLTGPWQVGGRADIPFQKMVRMDVDYLKTRSLLQDIHLILQTPYAILKGRGAY
jgi:exopolysaccharide biosynthesis WecB/TagA/CpsF family protein